MLNEKITFKLKGLNFKKFLNLLKKENIEVFNFKKCEYNIFYVTISTENEKQFLKITSKLNYIVQSEAHTPFLFVKNTAKRNLAFVFAIIFLCLSFVYACNFVFKIEIYGLQTVTEQEVISVLNKNNYQSFKTKSKYDLKNIELVLKNNIQQISFASAVIKGNTLIINIDEKINNDNLVYDYQPIVAPYDCIIESINLKSGTAVVQKGQSVKKGENIILPYINYKDGTQLKVEADADIVCYIELSHTTEYLENHTENVRSGKTQTQRILSLFNVDFSKIQSSKYSNYETVITENFIFKNLCLPIKSKTVTYYELIEKSVFVPFETVKQNIIEQNKKILYNNLVNLKTKEEMTAYTSINYKDNVYFVTTYLKAEISF